jgi:hypothetical protein
MKEAVTGVTGKRILIDQWVKIDQRVYIDFLGRGSGFNFSGEKTVSMLFTRKRKGALNSPSKANP